MRWGAVYFVEAPSERGAQNGWSMEDVGQSCRVQSAGRRIAALLLCALVGTGCGGTQGARPRDAEVLLRLAPDVGARYRQVVDYTRACGDGVDVTHDVIEMRVEGVDASLGEIVLRSEIVAHSSGPMAGGTTDRTSEERTVIDTRGRVSSHWVDGVPVDPARWASRRELPEEPIHVGSSWVEIGEISAGVHDTLRFARRYTVVRFEGEGDARVVVLDVVGTSTMSDGAPDLVGTSTMSDGATPPGHATLRMSIVDPLVLTETVDESRNGDCVIRMSFSSVRLPEG